MSKHTPGPWKHDDTYGLIVTRDGDEVAACHAGKTGRKTETLANAHLIAAAPEMLEALKEAVSDCPCTIKERYSGHRVGCRAPEWIELIVKAEGRDK